MSHDFLHIWKHHFTCHSNNEPWPGTSVSLLLNFRSLKITTVIFVQFTFTKTCFLKNLYHNTILANTTWHFRWRLKRWAACERKWFYSFLFNILPISFLLLWWILLLRNMCGPELEIVYSIRNVLHVPTSFAIL